MSIASEPVKECRLGAGQRGGGAPETHEPYEGCSNARFFPGFRFCPENLTRTAPTPDNRTRPDVRGGGGRLWTLHYVPIVSRFVQNTTVLAGPFSFISHQTDDRKELGGGARGGQCSVLMGIISFYLRQLSLTLILI